MGFMRAMTLKRIIGWICAGLGLLLILGIGGYFYLQSRGFHEYAIRKIVEEVNSATGGRATIGDVNLNLGTLTANLYDITLRGREKPEQPPLFHADKLTVRIKLRSWLHRQIALRELLLEHPVLHVEVSRNGESNLPAASPTQKSGHENVFDLAVAHAELTHGEIDYNDKKIPLEANVYDLGAGIRFEESASRYVGEFSYRNGNVRYANYASLPHALNLKFAATPQRFDLDSALLSIGSSNVALRAQLSNYADPIVEGEYRVSIHMQDFSSAVPTYKPAGDVSLNGKIHYQSNGNQPLIRDVTISGEMASSILSAAGRGRRVEVHNLRGSYQLGDGDFQLKTLALDLLGGRLAASGEMKHLDATPESSVRGAFQDVSIRSVQHTLNQHELSGAKLTGTMSGQAEASWSGSFESLRAHTDVYLKALAASRSGSEEEVPVDGAIHAEYDGPRQTIHLRDTSLHVPSVTMQAQGTVSKHSSLQMRLAASDLHQLASLIYSFYPMEGTRPKVFGSAVLTASVQGSLNRPTVSAQVSAQNLKVNASEWRSANLVLRANPSEFVIQNATFVHAARGTATLSGSVGLQDWIYRPANPIRAQLSLQQLQLTDLQQLAGEQYPVSGELSANLTFHGSELQPSGSGSAQITKVQAYGESIRNVGAKVSAENGTIASTLTVSAAAGAFTANLSYSTKTQAYKVMVNAPSVVLQKLRSVQSRDLGIMGSVSLSANGEGTIQDPQLVATLQAPQLQVRQNSASAINAVVRIAQHRADLEFNANVVQAKVHGHADVALSGTLETQAVIDTGAIPLAPLMAAYVPSAPQGFQGEAELHATLKGPLKDKSKMEAHVSIPVLKASYQSLEIGVAQPIRLDYVNSVVTLQPSTIQGTGTTLKAQGQMSIGGNLTPTLNVQGSVDARILQILEPTLQSSGLVSLDVHSSGPVGNPEIQGHLQFTNVALNSPDAPISIEQMNGTVNIVKDQLQVSNVTAQMGGGQVSLGGSIHYRPGIHFNLALQGKSVRLRYPEGLRSLLDANLAFTGTPQTSNLTGRVLIDSLSFTPDFDLSKFADQFSSGAVPPQPGFADTINLSVSLQSQQDLNAVSSQVSVAGQAALQVGGTAANPVITGRTTLTSGELFYRNVRYALQKGVITFNNPNETNPVLDVSVGTTVEQYNLTLTLRGPLDKLTTSYVSDPPLATADIINLIARGQTTQEAAASSQSTDSMIASQVAGELSTGIQKLAGISSLAIDPTFGGSQNPSARVALQQRVTKNLLFTFSTDVTQPGSEVVEGDYQINKQWSVSVQRDQVGGVSVDGRFHKQF